ncbi:MAG TPA: MauE/DoxX family redox-associated membrane protein [Candidatus Acidoferrales bacterium]|nr:MauE/DoxX family redox-associated membrane protein [Candidatus Acidoferrales bacterium]
MDTLGALLTWLGEHGYWFVLAGVVAAFCVPDPRKRRATVRIFLILGGIVVGSIFLAAAYGKMKPLPGFPWSWASLRTSISFFVIQVESYEVLSPGAASRVAHLLPFFELFLGLWLVSGIGRRFSALLASLVLCGFMAAIAFAYFRGLRINCGCGIGPDEEVGPAALLRDGLRFLLPAVLVMIGAFWVRRAPGASETAGAELASSAPGTN